MKKLLKIIGFTLLGIIAFLIIYALAGLGLGRMGVAEEPNAPDELAIYILTNGVHTDLVLPIKTDIIDWSESVKFEHTKSQRTDYNYLAIGWGDKGFYLDTPTWAELKVSTAFKAAFGFSTAAIHTTYYRTMQEGDDCVKIDISKKQYQRLVNYIQKDMIKKSNGDLTFIETDAVYGDSDAFYDATGSYTFFTTCNSWTNRALKAAGQKASVWTPFDRGIFYQYQKAKMATGSMYGW
ncbi:MAG: TIGR02117 family protein [Bacteroidota bacterium]